MAEDVRVWVKTLTLDEQVFGKAHSSSDRQPIPASLERRTHGEKVVNWGWAAARVLPDDDAGLTPAEVFSLALGGSEKTGDFVGKEMRVYVEDDDSEHNGNAISLPLSALKDGLVVLANKYDHEEGDAWDDSCPYPEDLICLTHLHEPAVVYCLRQRYSYDKIYTSTGPILLALNPFKNLKSLYCEEVMRSYYNRGEKRMLLSGSTASSTEHVGCGDGGERESDSDENVTLDDRLPPHVYGITDHSFRTMMESVEERGLAGSKFGGRRVTPSMGTTGSDQSILVSGESGAGKTVTTKFIMQYLAMLSKRSAVLTRTASGRKIATNRADIEQQVLQSNPILESFGNARTVRNDNSSRFGKFVEIQFTNTGSLVGAVIQTYLLEKVRIITQNKGERNYHIFYEILQGGMAEEDLERYFLDDYTAEDFRITSCSGTFDRRDGIEDAETYQDLMDAMQTVGFSETEQSEILTVVCALLHASNLTLAAISADESEIEKDNVHLEPFLSLMGFTSDALNRSLCYFSIMAGKEEHIRNLPKLKASKGLEALIKATYGALFETIVQRINSSIMVKEDAHKRGCGIGGSKTAARISVLDIFGFESFQKNSFEQLCINYCNESLQQQFNLFVLKNEQEEYKKEGIQWDFISFPESQDVLDLIGKKGSGIIPILDDQCRAPGRTDKTFANDIYQKCKSHSRFEATFRQVGVLRFGIRHYAGSVEYDTKGFVEKNRDDLPKEASELLLSSSNKFVANLAIILDPASSSPGMPRSPAGQRVTVGGQFSQQLADLRAKIDLTSPHYIRCLKPNEMLIPDSFDPVSAVDQLRSAGVVEAVRVSRLGYPQRYSHALFVHRYRILGLEAVRKASNPRTSRGKKIVTVLVEAVAKKVLSVSFKASSNYDDKVDANIVGNVGIEVGKTKVFLRQTAYESIEKLRNSEIRFFVILMQAWTRRYIAMRDLKRSLWLAIQLQCLIRRSIATKRVHEMRRINRATVIQTCYRRFVARSGFIHVMAVVRWGQTRWRGRQERLGYDALKRVHKSILIQKAFRMQKALKKFTSMRKAAITVQSAMRCYWAAKELSARQARAKDLSATVDERDALRDEALKLRKDLEMARALAQKETEKASAAALVIAGRKESETKNTIEIRKLQEANHSLETALKASKEEVKLVSALVADTKEATDKLSRELDVVQKENKNLSSTLEESKSRLNIASHALISMEQKNAILKKELGEARDLAVKSSKKMDEMEGVRANLEKEAEEIQASLDQANSELADLQKRGSGGGIDDGDGDGLDGIDSEISELNSQLVKALEDVTKVMTSEEGLGSERAQRRSSSVETFTDDLVKDFAKTRAELYKLKVENEHLTEDLDVARFEAYESKESVDKKVQQVLDVAEAFKRENKELRAELLTARKSLSEREEEMLSKDKELETARQMPSIPEDFEPDGRVTEILTLQDEIERLNGELLRAEEGGSENKDDEDSLESVVMRYEELSRLSSALVDKDREIDSLKRKLVPKKPLPSEDSVQNSREPSDKALDDPPTLQAAGNSSLETPAEAMTEGQDLQMTLKVYKDEVIALREINEMFRRDIESKNREVEHAKWDLREERKRSAQELEAFAETLRGVDELRSAAEAMSREITKNRQYYMTDESSGALDAAISIPSTTRKLHMENNRGKSGGHGFWGIFTGGGGAGGNVDESLDKKKSPRRRRKRRGSGDNSIVSAFF